MRKQPRQWWAESSAALGTRTKRYMRMLTILMAISLAIPRLSQGQSVPTTESPAPARIYHLLREDDDWRFLADPAERQEFWDSIKYIRLRRVRNDWFLSIGGEAREVWEQIGNDNWGQQPFMNAYFNERYMLYFDVHYGKHVRSFIELKSGLNSYRIGGPRPIDEKKLDFQAGFLEVGTSTSAGSIALRVGRQELEYGSGRFIDVREGPNVRLSFDGFMVKAAGDWDYEALWQFGTFGSANIKAWTAASETGYRIPTIPLKPRFSAKADISSGDDPRTNTLGTFNPLFPKGNYFGVLATAGPGPINFIDVHPRVEAALPTA